MRVNIILGVSLFINGAFICYNLLKSDNKLRVTENLDRVVEVSGAHRAGVHSNNEGRNLNQINWSEPDVDELVSFGLEKDEAIGVVVAAINAKFKQRADATMTITDPDLTCDELFEEGTKRQKLLHSLESERQSKIREATGQSWQDYQLVNTWSKKLTLLGFAAHKAGLDPLKNEMSSRLLKLESNIAFSTMNPFGIQSVSSTENQLTTVESEKSVMESLFTEDERSKFFSPFVAVKLTDVWSLDEQFGKSLDEKLQWQIIAAVTDDIGIASYLDQESAVSYSHTSLHAIREIVGDDLFSHFLSRQNPDLNWDAKTHLEVFELEDSLKREALRDPAVMTSARIKIRQNLGDRYDAYVASQRGAWLLPYLSNQ